MKYDVRPARSAAVLRLASVVVLLSCGPPDSSTPTSTRPQPAAPRAAAVTPAPPLLPCAVDRPTLGVGLTVERWPLGATPAIASTAPCIDVVRADLERHRLRVLSAATEGNSRTALEWQASHHLAAVTNAGMFHADGKPVGLIVEDGKAYGRDNQKMSGYLAWDPVSAGEPPVVLAGRGCPGFDLDDLRARYHSIVQSYRLLGCAGEALPWKDPKRYSAAAIGTDRSGRVVFLHARAPVTMSELSRAIAAHDLAGALFLEGGPEASLVAHGAEAELSRVGSYETGFMENDGNHMFWTLPNVIALVPR